MNIFVIISRDNMQPDMDLPLACKALVPSYLKAQATITFFQGRTFMIPRKYACEASLCLVPRHKSVFAVCFP